ncbi:MAG: hypothetical protein ACTSRQ_03755 [Candidatus Thorarchaeota archaeon]
MKLSKLVFVAIMLFIISMNTSPQMLTNTQNPDKSTPQNTFESDMPSIIERTDSQFSLSHTTSEGILDPLIIEQVGYTESGTLLARTDTDFNTAYGMYLDDTHNWVGSQVDVDIRDLSRLYLLNGSFSEGTEAGDTINPDGNPDFYPYGWGATSTYLGIYDQVQRVRYEDTGRRYIVVENKAELTIIPHHKYTHDTDTTVFWNQSIDVETTSSDYFLSFDYLYAFGPINGTGPDIPEGTGYVEVIIDGAVAYSISLIDLLSRDVWYSTGQIPLTINTTLNPVDFQIGLNINSTFDLDADFDYDNTPGADGTANAEFMTVYFDDVSLVSADIPEFNQVDLQLTVESASTPVIGSNGVGSASITNSTFWSVDPVNIEITSNTTVSFEYEAYLRSHRYSNSTWTTAIGSEGAHYTVNLDASPQIKFHTYIGSFGEYLNLTTKAWFPSDWDNMTIRDTFLDDVTSSCIVSENMVEIPTSLMTSQFGWWTFNIESSNYLKSIQIEKYDSTSSSWSIDSIYRSGNTSRTVIEVGSVSETPSQLDLVNVTWHLPNGTVWVDDSMSGGINGIVNSTPHGFSSLNTSAGLWTTCVCWHNGSEIAFGSTTFEIHHSTSLVIHESFIETESGDDITNFVYFTDAENGEYLLDPTASVSANWSVSSVIFGPDSVYNRWTGVFDTSLVGPGSNLVIVTANMQYYDEATCTFVVHSTFSNNEVIIDNPPSEIGLGDTFLVTFQYLDQYGIGIPNADIDVSFTGTADGLSWITPTNPVSGNYSIEFKAEHSGSYAISVSASKDLYDIAEDTVFILVGDISTSLFMENGSAAVIRYGEDFHLVIRYVNGTGYGLDSASISVESITPETGLDISATTSLGNGYFEIILTPQETSTFTILLNASLQDHHTKFESFTITATTIQSQLTSEQSSEVITFDQSCVVTLNLTSSIYGQLDGASVVAHNPPSELIFSSVTPLGNGLYSISISSTVSGSYQIVFIAEAANHNEASTSISLEVIITPTQVRVAEGLSSASAEFSEGYDLLVYYERTISPANISGATLSVNFTSFESLDWIVIPLSDGYIIRFTTDQIGRWEFTVTVSKADFQSDNLQFILFVNEIGTDLSGFSPSESLSFDAIYTFTFHYYLLNNQSAGISGATVIATGSGSDWISYVDLGNGYYNISVETQGLGRRLISLSFQKTGYQERSVPLDFTVSPTVIEIDTPSVRWDQFEDIELTLTLSQSVTGNLVSNATVSYVLYYNLNEEASGLLEEVSDGYYSVTISAPWKDSTGYEIRVFVEKENHALSGGYHSINVVQYPDPNAAITMFLATVIPQIGTIIGIVIVATIGQVIYSRKKKTQRAIDLVNKTRFSGAQNVLGIIVLHKHSGIPIYSKIWKSGFEEAMLSAFISAIMHFRSEFDTVDDKDEYRMIPISDIIRIIPTPNLICAFITLTSASSEQESKMIGFARAVGMTLDADLAERPTKVVDAKTAKTLEWFFDDFVDGGLLRKYQIGEKPLSGHFKRLVELLPEATSNGIFSLVKMIRALEISGLSEAEAHRLILDAIEKEFILPIYSFNGDEETEDEES